MKNRLRFLGSIVFCLAALGMTVTLAQEKKEGAKSANAATEEEMMKKWMEAATPGSAHQRLNDLVGSWEASTSMWMAPGQPSSVTKGTSESKWILDGRYVQQEFHGEMMGKPMSGMGLTGYDNMNKKYVGVWVDNMGTAVSTMAGTFDQSGKVLTMYGTVDEPTTGEYGKYIKYVTRFLSKDKIVFEIHDLSIGEPSTKIVEVTYTRKK